MKKKTMCTVGFPFQGSAVPLREFLEFPLIKLIKIFRRGQDPNLCGETPFDFESNALTTRPPRL